MSCYQIAIIGRMALSRFTFNSMLLLRQIGKTPFAAQKANIARWVAPTLREFKRRDRLLGPKAPEPRSGHVEWNYRAELFAFGKRLHEEFQLPLLQAAFTHRSYVNREQERQQELGIDVNETPMEDNMKLMERGQHIVWEYVMAFLKHALPKIPDEGHKSVCDYLISVPVLANVSSHLGTKELIYATEYPPSDETLANTLLAIIGALEQSKNLERAFLFIRDFICTQLNQKDLLDVWTIEHPDAMLKRVCTERKLGIPEPRLIGDCGKNTVLAAYNVGIYCNKEMIGEGYGEDIDTAIKAASLVALQTLFGFGDNMRPFDFQIQVVPKIAKLES